MLGGGADARVQVGPETVDQNFGGANPYAPAAASLGELNGETYGMPFVLSTPVLYYNASLFAAAGLDPANPPTTWAEFLTVCETINEKGGD